jgi:hypothetical protein
MTKLTFIGSALALCLTFFAESARADGVVTASSKIPADVRVKLEAEIAKAKTTQPKAFAAVAAVDTYKPSGIARVRHNKPTAARGLRQIGPAAFWPMIEQVAFKSDRGTLTDEQWHAFGDGLLQAISFLRNPNAVPVLEAIFLNSPDAVYAARAAEGLGMLCGDAQRSLLLSHVKAGDPQRTAAVVGLGHCRKLDVAQTLADVLKSEPADSDLAEKAARSLGYVASSWALAADKKMTADEGDAIRRTASEALVDAMPTQSPRIREVAAHSVLMAEHPSAIDRLAAAKNRASVEVRPELVRLEARVKKSIERASH